MSQHFLLSAKSRTISELEVARMSEDEARETFEKLYFIQEQKLEIKYLNI